MTTIERKVAIFLYLFPQLERGELLRRLKVLGLSRRGTGRALTRLLERGEVKKESVDGQTFFAATERIREWDGRFRLVIFDVPEKSRGVRDQLRQVLKNHGGRYWQRSVWVFWQNVTEDLLAIFKKRGWESFVIVVETERLPGIEDKRELARSIWKLESLGRAYEKILADWREGYERCQDDAEALKTLIRELTIRFLDIAAKDPLLPPQLLPEDWVGDEAFHLMSTLQKAPF